MSLRMATLAGTLCALIVYYGQGRQAAQQFTVQPESVVQAERLEAVFECLYPNTTVHTWKLNEESLTENQVIPGVTRAPASGDTPAKLTILATPQYNNTVVQCEALVREGVGSQYIVRSVLSRNTSLRVQGPLSDVSNLRFLFDQSSNTVIAISWAPPFSLNLTTAEPDIQYCVDVYDSTDALVESVCGVTEEHYSFSPDNLKSILLYNFTVTPRSNIEGALNGTTSQPVQGSLVQRTSLLKNASVTSNGRKICLSCSFSTDELTGCVGVIHSAQLDNLTLTVLSVERSGGENCTVDELMEGNYSVAVFGLKGNMLEQDPAIVTTVSTAAVMSNQTTVPPSLKPADGSTSTVITGVVCGVAVILLLLLIVLLIVFCLRKGLKLTKFKAVVPRSTEAEEESPPQCEALPVNNSESRYECIALASHNQSPTVPVQEYVEIEDIVSTSQVQMEPDHTEEHPQTQSPESQLVVVVTPQEPVYEDTKEALEMQTLTNDPSSDSTQVEHQYSEVHYSELDNKRDPGGGQSPEDPTRVQYASIDEQQLVPVNDDDHVLVEDDPAPPPQPPPPPTFETVLSELNFIADKWYELGEALGVPEHTLDNVSVEGSDPVRLHEVVHYYFSSTQFTHSWEEIVRALGKIGETEAADRIVRTRNLDMSLPCNDCPPPLPPRNRESLTSGIDPHAGVDYTPSRARSLSGLFQSPVQSGSKLIDGACVTSTDSISSSPSDPTNDLPANSSCKSPSDTSEKTIRKNTSEKSSVIQFSGRVQSEYLPFVGQCSHKNDIPITWEDESETLPTAIKDNRESTRISNRLVLRDNQTNFCHETAQPSNDKCDLVCSSGVENLNNCNKQVLTSTGLMNKNSVAETSYCAEKHSQLVLCKSANSIPRESSQWTVAHIEVTSRPIVTGVRNPSLASILLMTTRTKLSLTSTPEVIAGIEQNLNNTIVEIGGAKPNLTSRPMMTAWIELYLTSMSVVTTDITSTLVVIDGAKPKMTSMPAGTAGIKPEPNPNYETLLVNKPDPGYEDVTLTSHNQTEETEDIVSTSLVLMEAYHIVEHSQQESPESQLVVVFIPQETVYEETKEALARLTSTNDPLSDSTEVEHQYSEVSETVNQESGGERKYCLCGLVSLLVNDEVHYAQLDKRDPGGGQSSEDPTRVRYARIDEQQLMPVSDDDHVLMEDVPDHGMTLGVPEHTLDNVSVEGSDPVRMSEMVHYYFSSTQFTHSWEEIVRALGKIGVTETADRIVRTRNVDRESVKQEYNALPKKDSDQATFASNLTVRTTSRKPENYLQTTSSVKNKTSFCSSSVSSTQQKEITTTTVGSQTSFLDPRQDIIKERETDIGPRQVLAKGLVLRVDSTKVSSVLKCILFVLLINSVHGQNFTVQPESVVQAEGLEAVFECLYQTELPVSYDWFINGKLHQLDTPDVSRFPQTLGPPATLRIAAIPRHNNTVVTCGALVRKMNGPINIPSNNATVRMQGPLPPVTNRHFNQSSCTNITICWDPPFSLNLTTAEPDIQYCVDVYNVTGGGDDHLQSVCDITDTYYTFTASDPDQLFNFTVTPRSNVEGSLNGTTSQQVHYRNVPQAIPSDLVEFTTNSELEPLKVMFPSNVNPCRTSDSYFVHLQYIDKGFELCACTTNDSKEGDMIVLELDCIKCKLERHRRYNLTKSIESNGGNIQSKRAKNIMLGPVMRSGVDNQEVFSYQSFTVPGQESSETASSHDPLPGTNDIVHPQESLTSEVDPPADVDYTPSTEDLPGLAPVQSESGSIGGECVTNVDSPTSDPESNPSGDSSSETSQEEEETIRKKASENSPVLGRLPSVYTQLADQYPPKDGVFTSEDDLSPDINETIQREITSNHVPLPSNTPMFNYHCKIFSLLVGIFSPPGHLCKFFSWLVETFNPPEDYCSLGGGQFQELGYIFQSKGGKDIPSASDGGLAYEGKVLLPDISRVELLLILLCFTIGSLCYCCSEKETASPKILGHHSKCSSRAFSCSSE